MADTPRILIVGAGPTGLTAALELARGGIIPTIIDKKEGPSPLSRAVGILPSSMAIFEPSAVAEKIREKAIAVEALNVHTREVLQAVLPLDILPDPDMRILALPQDETEHIISKALEALGGNIRYNSPLEDMSQTEEGVSVTINRTTEHYDYVIGADGIRSKTRALLALPFHGYELEGDWSIADFDTKSDFGARQFNVFFLGSGNVAVIVPLGQSGQIYRYRAVASTADALAAIPLKIDTPLVRRAARFKIKIAQVEQYRKGRVFLAGDAAHCHSPVGGRGMNLGISDAAELSKRFLEGGLETYHDARHIEGKQTIERTEAARKFLMSTGSWKRGLFISLIRLARYIPALHRFLLKNMLTG